MSVKKILIRLLIFLTLLTGGGAYAWYRWTYYSEDVARSIDLNDIEVDQTTRLYDANGVLLDEIHGEEHRRYLTLDQIPQNFLNAVIAVEDSEFYNHNGVNFRSVGRAAWRNVRSREIQEGASTITMQLVKNMFLTNERTFERKAKEVVLAQRLEERLSKEEILELYVNVVAFGDNAYGIDVASENYFRKTPAELTLAEATFLAGIIKGPSFYSPRTNYQGAKSRQQIVLNAMVENNLLTVEEANAAMAEPLKLHGSNSWAKSLNPNITNVGIVEARQLLRKAVAEDKSLQIDPENIEKEGLRIYFTVEKETQELAERVVAQGCQNVKNRFRDRGTNVALVSIEPTTHHLKAIVGGCANDEFNRAYSSRRQPGSSFKPFIYLAAFSSGYKPESVITDAPVSFKDGSSKPYQPKNYGGSFGGTMTLRQALKTSRNVPAVVMGQRPVSVRQPTIKMNDKAISLAKDLGITTPLEPVISLPLGSKEVRPIEMANAYATLASGGSYAPPISILRIEDAEGNVLIDNSNPKTEQKLNPTGVAMLVDVLTDVVKSGTGTRANFDSARAIAGKTGTTDKQADVWFIGFTPQLSTTVWVGNDKAEDKLGAGATGGGVAAPIWANFMRQYHQGLPTEQFSFLQSYRATGE